jgi:hypothetical protein
MAREFFSRLMTGVLTREAGEPASANGASSFHLIWQVPSLPIDRVTATFELLEEPSVARLYFWALQVSFIEKGTSRGGGHLGLQWHPAYPDNRAVNWGGYGDTGELQGSTSSLPSTLDNINTRDFPWKSRMPYRCAVWSPEPGRWRGSVTDVSTGEETVVRDLYSTGTHLAAPMVWTEAFCPCEAPPVVARWSGLHATAGGVAVPVDRVTVNYQSYTQGGCTNTTVRAENGGLLQITGTPREVPQGRVISLQ